MASFSLLRCIGKAVLQRGVSSLLRAIPLMGVLADIAEHAYEEWRKESHQQQLRDDVEALAQASAQEVRKEVLVAVADIAGDEPLETRQTLIAYLNQVPSTIRRSLSRPRDPSGTTVPPDRTLQNAQDLLPLLPDRLPHFSPGDKPVGVGDWRLVELLGVGGFGEVWKACNTILDGVPPVALKFCIDAGAREQLLRHEAGILNQVMRQGNHPGIVQLMHTYLTADPPCLEYEYIDGGDLTHLIQEMHREGLPSAEESTQLVRNLAEIVAYAHSLSPPVVHRDLKPANILLQRQADGGTALKIADFGIGGLASRYEISEARHTGSSSQSFLATAVRGAYTPLYASPQQMRGDPATPQDDVHALGVIWYQILSGDFSMGAPSGVAWMKTLHQRGMSHAGIQLLASCMESQPNDRPANASDLVGSLNAVLGTATASTPVSTPVVPEVPEVADWKYEAIPEVVDLDEPAPAPSPPPPPRPKKTKRKMANPAPATEQLDWLSKKTMGDPNANPDTEPDQDASLGVGGYLFFLALALGGFWLWFRFGSSLREEHTISVHFQTAVVGGSFSPDGTKLTTEFVNMMGFRDVGIWDATTGKRIGSPKDPGKIRGATCLSNNRELLFAGEGDKSLDVYDWNAKKTIRSLSYPQTGYHSFLGCWTYHAASSRAICLFYLKQRTKGAILPPQHQKVTRSVLIVWDPSTGRQIDEVEMGTFSAGFWVLSPDGSQLAAAKENSVILLDAKTGKEIRTLAINEPTHQLAYHPNGVHLAVATKTSVGLWDRVTGSHTFSFPGMRSVSFDPSGKRIACPAETNGYFYTSNVIKVFDSLNGKVLLTLSGHKKTILFAAFGPKGNQLVSGTNNGEIKIWDVKSSD